MREYRLTFDLYQPLATQLCWVSTGHRFMGTVEE